MGNPSGHVGIVRVRPFIFFCVPLLLRALQKMLGKNMLVFPPDSLKCCVSSPLLWKCLNMIFLGLHIENPQNKKPCKECIVDMENGV